MGLQVHWISVVEIMHGFFWILNLRQSQWVGNKWVWILIFSYYIGQFNLAAATQTLSSPSLLQDTPLMRYLYQRSQSGILGTTTKRLVWDTTTASNLAVLIYQKKNLAVPLPSQLHTLIMLICNGVDHAYLQVGGWCQVYQGLTLVTVRGAGHEVPLHRPRQGLKLFEHFLRDEPMPKPVESVQSY